MLALIDESGDPYMKDQASRPVIVAVCIEDGTMREISASLYRLKRDILNKELMEIKAVKLLTRGTFRRCSDKREFVESVFDLLRNLPMAILAIIMERPKNEVPKSDMLPNQFRFLLERINLHAESRGVMTTVLFDGDGKSQYGGLALKLNQYLHRSVEGRSFSHITDAPFFVDSGITAGIQIAGLVASTIRQYEENGLFRGVPPGDSYLTAIRRYYGVVESKALNQTSAQSRKCMDSGTHWW